MDIQSGNSHGDIRSLVQDVGKEAIQKKGKLVARNIEFAGKIYTIEAFCDSKTHEIRYKMTPLSTRKVENTHAKKTHEFTEKLGLFGGRNIDKVEHKMADKLHKYTSMTDCIKRRVKHASNKEVTKSAYVNGQKYKIRTSAKGKDGTVEVTLTALDKTGKALLEKTFRCSNDRIDETGKALLEKVSVPSKGEEKTITRLERKVYTANLKRDMRTTRKALEGHIKDLEKIVDKLRSPSADVNDAKAAIENFIKEINALCPASDMAVRGNKDIGESKSHISSFREGMGGMNPADAAARLKNLVNEFKAAALGRQISDLVGVIDDPKVPNGLKQATRVKLAKIANGVLKSNDSNFVKAMGGLQHNLMCLAVQHGTIALAKEGGNKELMGNSREMLDCFKNENASLANRTLAMTKLGILHGAGFYGKSSLGKDIAKAAKKVVADMVFLGIAAMNGQGKDFAQKLRNELSKQGFPTDGNLFLMKDTSGSHFDTGNEATRVCKFEIGGLKVTVAEQKPTVKPPFPHICILDSNGQPLFADIRIGEIVENKETTPQTKLEELRKLENGLNQIPQELVRLGEPCADVVSPGKVHPGGQIFSRPPMMADECRKQQQRIQRQLSKTTPGVA
jgi:hypothetical protein